MAWAIHLSIYLSIYPSINPSILGKKANLTGLQAFMCVSVRIFKGTNLTKKIKAFIFLSGVTNYVLMKIEGLNCN